ncbi:putative Homeobox-leucine zipper protein ROC5 [Glarea lozoyensis 74030]|uniref:Putative Homeobox-leucine zipper protein ROC5 n=1 Tax=Glarea lozoyensis (strain ATCC 74030 / MF5533) TaxID=1104152 RepID=H0EX25_GLAL7|nr:putative Homeobox-leucine zipper protein ROC5 [Glarea lozoyensis 74030]
MDRKQRSSSAAGEDESGDVEGERTQNKQRRKRTTPQDQAKLEAEYKLNPKPNKAARAEIVKNVSLNEKEVQIAAFGLGGMPALSSDPVSSSSSSGPESEENGAGSKEVAAIQEDVASHALELVEPRNANGNVEEEPELEVIPSSQVDPDLREDLKEQADAVVEAMSNPNSSSSDNVSKSFSSTPGYLANRWNTMHSSFSTPSASQVPIATTPPVAAISQPSSCPERLESSQRTPSSRLPQPEKDVPAKDSLVRSPSGDSDKENWAPPENGVNSRRRPLPSGKTTKQSAPRAVLGDNTNVPTHALNFGGPEKRRRKNKNATVEILEDQENVPNEGGEVESFMKGAVSPSKKGDLDCVQGLLSLSQGNWR